MTTPLPAPQDAPRKVNPILVQKLQPATLVCVKTSSGPVSRLIAAGEALIGHAGAGNHIAMMRQWTDGIPHGDEGRPGGYGPIDMRRYIRDRHTLNNVGQPMTPEQRDYITKGMDAMSQSKTGYDWEAIWHEIWRTFNINIPMLFQQNWNGQGYPGKVICSSVAGYLYYTAPGPRLEIPDVTSKTVSVEEEEHVVRFIEPTEWGDLWLSHDGWNVPLWDLAA